MAFSDNYQESKISFYFINNDMASLLVVLLKSDVFV